MQPLNTSAQSILEKTKTQTQAVSPQEVELSLEHSKDQLDLTIVTQNLSVDLSVKKNPLSLVYRNAVDKINELLAPQMGPNAIEKAYQNNVDVSPEATADRIVGMSTAFYSAYREQHPELSEQEAKEKFVDLISGGIDRGFAEAKEIIDSLGILNGRIASNIDETYELVQLGLAEFLNGGEEP